MAGLSINLDIDPGLKRLRETTPKAQRALARALNTSAITTRAEASRRIHAQGFRFKVSTIKDALKIKKASATGATLNVSIDARGYPNALIKFDVFPKPSPKGRGFARPAVGIWATVLGKTYGAGKAFYARMPSGHVGVFLRHGPTSLPINAVLGPALPDALEFVGFDMQQVFADRFDVVLKQQLKYEFGT